MKKLTPASTINIIKVFKKKKKTIIIILVKSRAIIVIKKTIMYILISNL